MIDELETSASPATHDLAWLIHPVPVEMFLREHWERRHFLVRRQRPEYFDELMTLARFDALLTTTSVTSSQVRVVRDGRVVALDQIVPTGWRARAGALEALLEHYRGGASIVVQGLDERDRALQRLCQALATELSASLQVNVYLTPAGARGLGEHYDTHDVFVVQVEGAKRWRVRPGPIALPCEHQPPCGALAASEPIDEFVLRRGDVLYVPRGLVHEVIAEDGPSLHLTIGVHPLTWAHLIRAAVDDLFARDARFREGLPPGFTRAPATRERAAARLDELLVALGEGLDRGVMLEDAAEAVLRARPPTLDGHLLDLRDLDAITLDTRLRRRDRSAWQVHRDGERVRLRLFSRQIEMPGWLEDELRFMGAVDGFTLAEMPTELDEAGRLVLARQLLTEGALTIDRRPLPSAAPA